jgi:hypothetical protein
MLHDLAYPRLPTVSGQEIRVWKQRGFVLYSVSQAPDQNDPRIWKLAAHPACALPCFALGERGYCARIQEDNIRVLVGDVAIQCKQIAHHLRFVLVDAATERLDRYAYASHARRADRP